MSKKISIEETKEIFAKVGLYLDESETEAKGVDTRYECYDSEGYKYSRTLRNVRSCIIKNKRELKCHVFSIKNPYFYYNMQHYIELNVSNGTKLLSLSNEIKNIDQYLTFHCGECGRDFKSTWHTFIKKQDKCCNVCFNRKRSNRETNSRHIDTNKFHLAALENNFLILDGPQVRYHDKITVQDKEGYRGLTTPANILAGNGFERFGKNNPYTLDNIRLYAFNKHWDCVIYNQEYKGDKYPLKMMCSCGNDFMVDLNHFVVGKFQCNECRVKQSYIAQKVEDYLKFNNIQYIKEKTFQDCRNIKVLPFDFYLVDYGACIEVDGLGHYRPVQFGGSKQEAETNYNQRVKNDKIKTDYCNINNIPLLRLPFWIIENDNHILELDNFIDNLSIRSNDPNNI